MSRVWAAKEEVSVELCFGFAKIRTLYTGTQSLQQFSFVLRIAAIRMNQCDAFQSLRTSQIFVWMWHFQLHLCRPNLTYGFISYGSDYWDTTYPEITTQLTSVSSRGLAIYIWRLTTSAFEPHWRIQGKVSVKGPKRSLRNLFLKFLLLHFIQQGN